MAVSRLAPREHDDESSHQPEPPCDSSEFVRGERRCHRSTGGGRRLDHPGGSGYGETWHLDLVSNVLSAFEEAIAMWACPKCQRKISDDFDVCWSCGTTSDGVEDPDFVTADEAEPIADPPLELDLKEEYLEDEFGGVPFPDLVACYMAQSALEAKFLADRLVEQGIPALADKHDLNTMLGGFKPQLWGNGPCVRVRPEDLTRAVEWLKGYEAQRLADS